MFAQYKNVNCKRFRISQHVDPCLSMKVFNICHLLQRKNQHWDADTLANSNSQPRWKNITPSVQKGVCKK